MCWAVPGRIVEIDDDVIAKVDFGGVTRQVLMGFEKVGVGDLVMVHSGVVIGKTTESEIVSNLGLFIEVEKIGLQEMGHSAEEAKAMAEQEFTNLVSSLGLESRKYLSALESPLNTQRSSMPETPKTQPPLFSHKERFRTTLSDMDYLQVMHYSNYFRLCERAWMGLLASIGFGYSSLIHRYGVFIPTVEAGGKILSPVRMDNEVEMAVWIEEIGRKHIKYRTLIRNLTSNNLAADIYHVAVCTDTALMESVELPAGLSEKLSAFVTK